MPHWFEDNSQSVGHTPLVRLNRVTDGATATVLAKIEGRNPAYSVKCRIGAAMVKDAEQRGLLGQGKELVEPTSGNTGIALAFVAKLVLTEGAKGMSGAVAQAEAIAASDPGRYVLLQQFRNPANPKIHEETTGPKMWDDTGGAVDIFVSGVGTGGTMTGGSRYLKQTCGKPVVSVAVEPATSSVLTQCRAGEPLKPVPPGFEPPLGFTVPTAWLAANPRSVPGRNAPPGFRTEAVGKALNRQGIAVRAGHHCAQPILRRFSLETTVRPSFALYNTREDLDALVAAVRRIQAGSVELGR
jgi:hypothetical protein